MCRWLNERDQLARNLFSGFVRIFMLVVVFKYSRLLLKCMARTIAARDLYNQALVINIVYLRPFTRCVQGKFWPTVALPSCRRYSTRPIIAYHHNYTKIQ